MTQIESIISKLEQHSAAIGEALAALRGVESPTRTNGKVKQVDEVNLTTAPEKQKKPRVFSADARRRMAAAQNRRWAKYYSSRGRSVA
jgi:hypothetical protein